MDFKDHFSGHAREYSECRPHYPPQLFIQLATMCPTRDLAWDCATGSGQSALGLATHFKQVLASDASANQIANATPAPGIEYVVATAESSGLEAASIDLITVAQALHWFDIDRFADEADRVLKPGGILAAWTYWLASVNEETDAIVAHFHNNIVGEYWAFDRSQVENGYAGVTMPFAELSYQPPEMTANWSFSDLLGYLDTWSASRAYAAATGQNPLQLVQQELQRTWGDPAQRRDIRWPMQTRIWRKP